MMIKGKERDYQSLFSFILGILLSIYPIIQVFKFFWPDTRYAGDSIFNIAMSIFISFVICALIIGFVAVIFETFFDRLDMWLNVKIRTAETKEEIQEFLVVARFAGYEAGGAFGFTDSNELFSVKIRLCEDVYHTFHNVENYAAAKEGEMARVKVKLYIDTEGDVFYIEPLNIIGGYKENTEKSTEAKTATS